MLGIVYAFKANGVSFLSLYMLLIGGSSVDEYDVNGAAHIVGIVLIVVAAIPSAYFAFKDIIVNRKEYYSKVKGDGIIMCMALMMAAMCLTFITTAHYANTFGYIMKYSLNIVFAIMVLTKVDINDKDQVDNVLFSVGVMILTIGGEVGLRLVYMATHLDKMRGGTFGGNFVFHYDNLWDAIRAKQVGVYWNVSNHWVMFTNIGLIMMLPYIVFTKKIGFKIYAATCGLIGLGLGLITFCRAGYLGLLAALIISIYVIISNLKNQRIRKCLKICYISCAMVGVVILGYLICNTSFGDTLFDKVLYSNGRNILYQKGIEDFKNNWLLGTGAGTSKYNIQSVWNTMAQKIINYHNCFIQMAATCGIIGLVSFLVYILGCILRVYKRNMLLSSFVGIAFVCSFVHGQFDTFFPSSESMVVLTMLLCLIPRRQSIQIVKNEEL
ncbi:MAG: O-antigen ligase family protein [Acholeplasmatales bacterium]|nr:O-antigen ligase family protein [Acholeplasmatales bacterium]